MRNGSAWNAVTAYQPGHIDDRLCKRCGEKEYSANLNLSRGTDKPPWNKMPEEGESWWVKTGKDVGEEVVAQRVVTIDPGVCPLLQRHCGRRR